MLAACAGREFSVLWSVFGLLYLRAIYSFPFLFFFFFFFFSFSLFLGDGLILDGNSQRAVNSNTKQGN